MASETLEERAVGLLQQLIRHNTVNPPGNERVLQEELAEPFRAAGFEVTLIGSTPERPNLVARLKGHGPGPVLGLLSFRPLSGWVREVAATVAPRERVLGHAAEVRRHLGLEAA